MTENSTGRTWVLLFGMWSFGLCVTAFQIVPAGVLPLIMTDLSIGAVAAGWLLSASLAAQAVGNVPIGIIIDRTSNRLILTVAAAGMLVAGVLAWQAAVAGAYWPLIGAIALGGIAIAGVITGGANLIGGAFSGEREATAVAAFTTAAPAGYAVGQVFGPLIAERFGWGANFLLFGTLAVVAYAGLMVIIWRIDFEPASSTQPSLADFTRLLGNRSVWIVCLLGFLAYSLYLLFNSWMPSYINDQFGYSLAESAMYAALFPVTGVLARAGGGYLSDNIFERRRRPVAYLAFGVTIPLVVLITVMDVPLILVVLLVPAGFFVQVGIGLFYTYVREVVEEGVTGTALAMLGFISFAGAFTSPVIAGALIDVSGAYVLAFGYAGLLAVVGVALTYLGPEPNPR